MWIGGRSECYYSHKSRSRWVGRQEEPGLVGGKTVEGIVVRFEVKDVGGGSAVACVINSEVGNTAPDLQISVVIP